ncbi:MAG: hypothetical protein ACMVO3_19275 [Thalassobaculum sp.]
MPYEVELVEAQWFIDLARSLGATDMAEASSLFVKFCYAGPVPGGARDRNVGWPSGRSSPPGAG